MNKKVLIIICSVIIVLLLGIMIPFIILGVKTNKLNADYKYLLQDENYKDKVEIAEIELVKQQVSCGYASIEMVSTYYGNKVNEEELDAKNKSISTSSTKGFLKEINDSIPSKTFIKREYLKNDCLIKEENAWTLHFSVVTGLDIVGDVVTIYNPYGYIEQIGLEEFIARTTFKAYQKMPLFLKFGFAFGAFGKNTIVYAE